MRIELCLECINMVVGYGKAVIRSVTLHRRFIKQQTGAVRSTLNIHLFIYGCNVIYRRFSTSGAFVLSGLPSPELTEAAQAVILPLKLYSNEGV
jgi:hypothetical protein